MTKETSLVKKIEELDMIKGIGILAVVCIHLLSISGLKQYCGVGIKIEMSLCTPLMIMFFILSGYLKLNITESPLKYLGKRMKRIFVPYYVMAVILLIAYAIIYLVIEKRSPGWYIDGAIGILLQFQSFHWLDTSVTGFHTMYYGAVVGWFLFQMAVAEVIFVPVSYKMKDRKHILKLISAAAFLVLGAILYLLDLQGLNEKPMSMILIAFILPNIAGEVGLMLLGEFLGAIAFFDFGKYSRPAKMVTVVASLAMIVVFMATDNYKYLFPFGTWGAFGALSFLTATLYGLALIIFLGIVCNIIKRSARVKRMFSYLGRMSMSILVTHYFLAYLIAYICGFWYEPMAGAVPAPNILTALGRFMIMFAVLAALCCPIPWIVKKAEIKMFKTLT